MEPIPHRADDPPTTPAPAAGPPVHATDLDAPAEPPAADDTAGTRRRGTTTPRTVTLTIPDPRTVLTAEVVKSSETWPCSGSVRV